MFTLWETKGDCREDNIDRQLSYDFDKLGLQQLFKIFFAHLGL